MFINIKRTFYKHKTKGELKRNILEICTQFYQYVHNYESIPYAANYIQYTDEYL
jgi:hypothetical protein